MVLVLSISCSLSASQPWSNPLGLKFYWSWGISCLIEWTAVLTVNAFRNIFPTVRKEWLKLKKLDSYCWNLQEFVAMAVIKILNDNQAFSQAHAIYEKTNTRLFQKHCLQHILLFIKTNTDVNAVLNLLIIFPPLYQTAFFQNTNSFMQIREGFFKITLLF